jgi:hypothetical protein
MRGSGTGWDAPSVNMARARVVLELDAGEPISGSLCGPSGVTEPFRGWVELTSLLERLRSTLGAVGPGGGDEREAGK